MIFRLAGIYGPGRNLIERFRKNEKVYVVDKLGLFNRIHIKDIVGAIEVARIWILKLDFNCLTIFRRRN